MNTIRIMGDFLKMPDLGDNYYGIRGTQKYLNVNKSTVRTKIKNCLKEKITHFLKNQYKIGIHHFFFSKEFFI